MIDKIGYNNGKTRRNFSVNKSFHFGLFILGSKPPETINKLKEK